MCGMCKKGLAGRSRVMGRIGHIRSTHKKKAASMHVERVCGLVKSSVFVDAK